MDVRFILFQIFLIFLCAKVAGEIFERLKQPALIGELLVGILLSSSVLGIIRESEVFDVLAEIGAIVLLFTVGLETRVSDLKKVGVTATTVAVMGIVVPFVLGYAFLLLSGFGRIEAMFVGAAMVATSIGITARILTDMNIMASLEAKIILGAAIVDDILGMIVLTIVSGIGRGNLNLFNTSIIIIEAILFVGILMILGSRVVDKFTGRRIVDVKKTVGGKKILHYRTKSFKRENLLARMRSKEAPFIIVLLVCFGLSALASYIGLAAIIGAFFAGMMFADTKKSYDLEKKMKPINIFLVPFFFVITGTKVDFSGFWNVIGLTIALTILAILGKLIACGVGAMHHGKRSAMMIGAGMIPRGEVGIIVAMIGLNLGIIEPDLYSVIILMSIITTLYAPPLLKIANKI